MASAARHPHQTAVIDDAGSLTWREMSHQINQLTDALAERESATLVMLDEEFVPLAQELPAEDLMLTWRDGDSTLPSVAQVIEGRPTAHHRQQRIGARR